MLADCDRCALGDTTCAECVITVLPDGPAGLGHEELRALRVLADAGLIPPLRLAPAPTRPAPAAPAPGRDHRPPRSPRTRTSRHTRNTGHMVPARLGIEIVKVGPESRRTG
jgi:hypothetical protein